MNKHEAKKKILDYFKEHSIEFMILNEDNKPRRLDDSDTLYLSTGNTEVIGGYIETTIRFKEEHLYCMSYYCKPLVYDEEEAIRAARIVNYLNNHLSYDCDTLYDHTFIFDEDKGDVYNGCLIRYELLEEYFYDSMDHILNFGVQQIADVSFAVLCYIQGELDYFTATKVAIDHKLMGKPIPGPED